MSNCDDIMHGRHYVSSLNVHLVFISKYRRGVFDADAIERLRAVFVEMDGGEDHVHLLVEYPPKASVSTLVNSLKGVSARLLRKERPDIQRSY